MADNVVVKVDLHGLEEDLLQLGPKISKKLFRIALKFVGELWKAGLKARVPSDTGNLAESIDYVIKLSPKQDSGTVTVGPTYIPGKNGKSGSESPGIYGMFVEFGLKLRKYVFTPWMRPEFDATADAMIEAFAASLREDLEEAIKR
jgi:hypothetical protein